MGLLRRGLTGEPVRLLQEKLGVNADGIFGPGTEAALIAFQRESGLSPDGIAGPDTFLQMNMPELVLLHRPLRGETVRKVQEALGIGADGVFGAGTEAAVKTWQRDNGFEESGVIDPGQLARIPGFEVPEAAIELSVLSEATPAVDPGAVEEIKLAMDAPPETQSFVSQVIESATAVPRSIWNTVKSIF